MADPLTLVMLLEYGHQMELLLAEDELDEEEKEELAAIWESLKSRQESKFDAIINLIKECDKHIGQLDKELSELKTSKKHWETKRKCIINIIKVAYERDLIDSKPTGNKYQATIRAVKPKLIDNYNHWSEEERKNFTLRKKTTITRSLTDEIINEREEEMPDKEKVKKALETYPESAPKVVQLVRRVSLTYNLRKRIKKGI